MADVWIGIDPGLSGAVAVLTGSGEVHFYDVPARKAVRGEVFMPAEMANLFRALPYGPGSFAALEEVSAPRLAPGVGAGSGRNALKIGYGSGLWEGILAAFQIPYERPAPAAWKKVIGLPAGADKKASRAKAQALFPAYAAELAKRRPDFSEALLLAEWGRRRIER